MNFLYWPYLKSYCHFDIPQKHLHMHDCLCVYRLSHTRSLHSGKMDVTVNDCSSKARIVIGHQLLQAIQEAGMLACHEVSSNM